MVKTRLRGTSQMESIRGCSGNILWWRRDPQVRGACGLHSYCFQLIYMPTAFTVRARWTKSRVSRRRVTFFSLIFLLTTVAAWFMADLLWQGPMNLSDLPLLVLFTILFGNIAHWDSAPRCSGLYV